MVRSPQTCLRDVCLSEVLLRDVCLSKVLCVISASQWCFAWCLFLKGAFLTYKLITQMSGFYHSDSSEGNHMSFTDSKSVRPLVISYPVSPAEDVCVWKGMGGGVFTGVT